MGDFDIVNLTVDETVKYCIEKRKYTCGSPRTEDGSQSRRKLLLLLLKGDRAEDEGDYETAVLCYTTGLLKTFPSWNTRSTFYFHRANCLKNLKLYTESLLDVQRAKIYFSSLENVRVFEEWERYITKELKNAERTQTKSNLDAKNYNEVPKILNENKDLPGVTDAIRMVYDETHGRHFVATKLIETGDVILIQTPYASAACSHTLTYDAMSCCHCFKFNKAPIPCDFCDQALYCSEACREEAYRNYHHFECGPNTSSSELLLILRFLLKVTERGDKLKEAIEYTKKLDAMSKQSTERMRKNEKEFGYDMKSILNLSLSMDKDQTTLKGRAIVAAMLAAKLQNYFAYTNANDDVLGFAMLLLRLLYIEDVCCVTSKEPDGNSAYSYYPILAALCHSCSANTVCSFRKGHTLVLQAARTIKPGEMITFNFIGENVLFTNAIERQAILTEQKHVNACQCTACKRNYTFMPELRKLDIPVRLRQRLRKCPTDIEGMWELLKIINDDIKRPCLELEILKIAIRYAHSKKECDIISCLYTVAGVF